MGTETVCGTYLFVSGRFEDMFDRDTVCVWVGEGVTTKEGNVQELNSMRVVCLHLNEANPAFARELHALKVHRDAGLGTIRTVGDVRDACLHLAQGVCDLDGIVCRRHDRWVGW